MIEDQIITEENDEIEVDHEEDPQVHPSVYDENIYKQV